MYVFFFYEFQSLPFTTVAHAITKVDSQPTLDGGVLVHVLGQVKVCKILSNFFEEYDSSLQKAEVIEKTLAACHSHLECGNFRIEWY